MAVAASTGGTPGGPGDSGPGAASPAVQPGPREESILPASINDLPTDEDSLGFTPYVEALAAFLTHPATEAPLTISIEGRWGSGKSSFMRQLEREIKVAENRRRQSGTSPPSLIVRFNPWRHDKEEALWAAFALEFLRQVREQRRFPPRRWWGDLKLFCRRYSWKTGWTDLICKAVLWLCILFVIALVVSLALFRGPDYIKTAAERLAARTPPTPQTILDWTFRLSGGLGCLSLLIYVLVLITRHIGNPLKVDLQKHLKSPQYEGSVSFVEKFHHDFSEIVKAYAGTRRVYVFIDDLDRCQVPKAADLMQAINLMISGDARLVFVIGMDWEMVAAGVAAKNARLVPYLKPSAERKEDALDLGRDFVEKFIQLRFALPRPGDGELKNLVRTLSQAPARRRNPGFWRKLLHLRFLSLLRRRLSLLVARVRGLRPGTTEQDGQQQTQAGAPNAKRQELIQFDTDADSSTIQAIALALAPAFENNPRRIKQFLGLYRLRTYIAKQTGLLAVPEGRPDAEAVTLEQLGKITALELLRPSLLQEAQKDHGLLKRREDEALESEPTDEVFTSQARIRELFQVGFREHKPGGWDHSSGRGWSLANLDVGRLLRVSPYVGPFDAKVTRLKAPSRSFLLHVPRVPFKHGQDADFIKEQIPHGSGGFRLKITVPQETYWRCGFVLAPEDYIREGRADVTIMQYFLFHVARGMHPNPKQPTGLSFWVYRQDLREGPQPFDSEGPIEVDVAFGTGDGHVAIGFGDKRYETDLDPSYLRYLYILAWADMYPPFRVPVELTLL